MTHNGPPEERAARGPRLPLVALLAADAISLTGNAMGFVAIPWFVLVTTGSAALTGVVAALTFAPTVLATFFGGGIVDRLGFRRTTTSWPTSPAASPPPDPAPT